MIRVYMVEPFQSAVGGSVRDMNSRARMTGIELCRLENEITLLVNCELVVTVSTGDGIRKCRRGRTAFIRSPRSAGNCKMAILPEAGTRWQVPRWNQNGIGFVIRHQSLPPTVDWCLIEFIPTRRPSDGSAGGVLDSEIKPDARNRWTYERLAGL